jgi:hypothetical protein
MSTFVFTQLFYNVSLLNWRREINPSEDTSLITAEIRRIIEEIESLGQDIFEREPLRATYVNQLIGSRMNPNSITVFEMLKMMGLFEFPRTKMFISTWLSDANPAYEPEILADFRTIFALSDMR